MERKRDYSSSISFPAVLTLMEDDGSTTAKERLVVYVSIPLEGRLAVLVLMKDPRNLRVMWGSKNLLRYYSQPSLWDGEVVAFM